MAKPASVSKRMVNELAKLKDVIPLIRALTAPGLQKRHIENIFK
jgi:hypothetical protein